MMKFRSQPVILPRKLLLSGCFALIVAACAPSPEPPVAATGASDRLLVFAGDQDQQQSDFFLVVDVNPSSKTRGMPVSTTPIGHKMSMPHHMDYVMPPSGEPIFANAHHHELSLIVKLDDANKAKVVKSFAAPSPLRFPHDYERTQSGTRLVGFLRGDGPSPDPDDNDMPGNHGGIAEYRPDGTLIRSVSAAVPGMSKPVRPYAFAILPKIDRFVVTSAPMMEKSWADVIQIYRYSDFKLLHTMALPVASDAQGRRVPGSQAAGFGPRILDDGSVFLNSYGCGFFHLTDIGGAAPRLDPVYALETRAAKDPKDMRGACGIPVRVGRFWFQPVGEEHLVVVLDIANPRKPREVARLRTPDDFKPHWLARDPKGNRLILGAEMGHEQGFYMLRFDERTGRIAFDPDFSGSYGSGFLGLFKSPRAGYVSLDRDKWPHGTTGTAWGHAALFFDRRK